LHRQISALRGAALLTDNGLGHLTLPLARTACEERIWIEYVFSLAPEPRDMLISLMVRLEGSRIVGAQQQYFGAKLMKRLGFPKPFVTGQAKSRTDAEHRLGTLGKLLDWDAQPGQLPSIGWLASKTGLSQLYEFVYAATSKGVHFSPSEHFRSGWTGAGPDDPVTFLAHPYTEYRGEFGLYWLSVLFIETLATLIEHGTLGDTIPGEAAADEFGAVASAIRSFGPVPIALAAEFNLRQE
jgi:hypothetical protein